MADALCIAHLFDEAVLQSKKTLQMDPNFAIGHHELGQAFEQKHMHDEAIAEFQKAIRDFRTQRGLRTRVSLHLRRFGKKGGSNQIAKDLEAQHDQNPSAEANIALIYLGLRRSGPGDDLGWKQGP